MRFRLDLTWIAPPLGLLLLTALMVTVDADRGLADEQKIASDNPLSGDPEAIEKGRRLFNTWCTQCHGGKADGVSRFGAYAADLRRFNKGFYEFAGITVSGIVEKQMPPWGEVLDGDQISQVGAYLETLAIDGAKWAVEE